MTNACHRFDTNKVHYYVRSSGLRISKVVLLNRVSHPKTIYGLGWPQKKTQSCFEQNQFQTDEGSCGEGFQQKMLKNT